AAGARRRAAGPPAGEIEPPTLPPRPPAGGPPDPMAPGPPAGSDAQPLFYPPPRANAPAGVVGDPRRADAARGLCYLRAWTRLLVDAYRGEKNSHQATGTKNA